MNTPIEPRISKFARWKLNLIIFLLLFNMIGITLIIGSLNQINKNITSINAACLLSEVPSILNFQNKKEVK